MDGPRIDKVIVKKVPDTSSEELLSAPFAAMLLPLREKHIPSKGRM